MDNLYICEDQLCTGCLACYNICKHNAVSLIVDKEGFTRPRVKKDSCLNCGMCKSVCPVIKPVRRNEKPLQIYSGWSNNDETRVASASGGAFTEIASAFINRKKGVVYGVSMGADLEAHHIAVESKKELSLLQGSKYIQSNIDYTYRQVEDYLKNDRYILFSGTSCQIAGLKNYLRRNYDKLYTIDLICHGVPSVKLFKDYVGYIEKKIGREVYDVKFRCKKNSWIFFNMAINSHIVKKTKKIIYDYEGGYYSDPFIRCFLRDNALRPNCYKCLYTNTSRIADFTIADWWGYSPRNKHEKEIEKKGVSLVFCNTDKAVDFLGSVDMNLRERTLEEAMKTNKSLKEPFAIPKTREEFWSDYEKLSFDEMIKKWMAPEHLIPSRYLLYKMRSSKWRSLFVRIAKQYEKISGKFGFKCLLIKA